ncbi:LysR family transcriptional regulator [Paraburkholderia sp.]|uniref:LysR family transcriptional regulator n=1 Tax=Paraburkholderia sp. TaxID=1926495 RepID=UPI003D6EE785
MKLDDIEAFVAVVRCQSLNQAAESLDLTQPAVTRRLQNFEEALGVLLLDRNTKPLKPTPMGLVVYEQCRAIVRELDVLRELVAGDAPLAGVLRIGVAQTVADVALLDALRELKLAHPDLQARVSIGWGAQLLQKLEGGALDAAVTLLPANRNFPEGLQAESLGSLKLAVIASKGSMKRRPHTLAECEAYGWVLNPDGCGFRAGLQHALASQGLTLKLNLETFGTELQLGLVAEGVGLGLVPLPLLQASPHAAQLDVIALSDFKPEIAVWMVRSRTLGKLESALAVLSASIEQRFKAARIARAA